MIDIVIEKGDQAFDQLRDHWPVEESDYFFNQYEWINSTVRTRGNGELVMVCVYTKGHLSAVLPMQLLQRRSHGLSFTCLGFIEPDHLFIHGLIGLRKKIPRIKLSQITKALRQNGIKVECVSLRRLYDYRLIELVDFDDAFHLVKHEGKSNLIDCGEGFDHYLSRLSSNRRQGLRKKRKRLEKLGSVSVLTSESDCADLLERYLVLEKGGWKGESGNAILNTASQTDYYRDVAARKATVIQLLTLNNVDVAAQIMVASVDTLFVFKTSFDEDYKKYSPGELLLLEAVKYAVSNNMRYVNLITDLPWHHHLANSSRHLHSYTAYILNPKSILLKILSALKKVMKKYRKKYA